MIKTLVKLKHRFPGLWNLVEPVNGFLFRLRYPNVQPVARKSLAEHNAAGTTFSLISGEDLDALETFLRQQPEESFKWFRPHDFDRATLERLFRNPAFLMMKVSSPEGALVGYFFLRGFFVGRAFAGLLVDPSWRNKGIGAEIWASCADICQKTGLKMQATISTENLPSIHSCKKGTDVLQVKTLEDTYLAVECRRKT